MIKTGKKSTIQSEEPISVADFIERINTTLVSHHGRVRGEVTSINKNYSTAIYFTIMDEKEEALLDCLIWRSVYDKNGIELEVGDAIIVTGTPEVYAPKGRFSLKAHTIEYAGEGTLKKAYDALKKKLSAEGLFALERKRELPKYPQRIGVITSKVGVVLQDFISNLGRYGFKVIMVDSRVEGKDAIHDILASIHTLEKEEIEVLVIMRGGGSWESLQPFNTESVVRAIANFKHPVLTGIGHDVDVTLAEMIADVGKSTPTAVAETLNESWDMLRSSIDSAEPRILGVFQRLLSHLSGSIETSSSRIFETYYRVLSHTTKHLQAIEKNMTLVDPEYNLRIGYSLSYVDGKLVRSVADISVGEMTETHVSDGKFTSEVTNVE